MTRDKAEKAVVRERMQRTGESYTAARAKLASSESASDAVVRICSFCGKTQDETPSLIAGPGVHICRNCIDLCAEIVSAESADSPSTVNEPTEAQMQQVRERIARGSTVEAQLIKLRELRRSQSQVDRYVARAVHSLRAAGGSWAQIAEALQMSPEAAEDCYPDVPEE